MTRRTALRLLLGFLVGLLVWVALSSPYERALAGSAGAVLRLFERPAVTRLEAAAGGIRIERRDFPPGSPRPVLPATDIHFNFVLLLSLFAIDLPGVRFGRSLSALILLFLIHITALVFQVQSVYAMSLGAWSAAHYGPFARNVWAGGFHFYQIVGRFAAPFALWWALVRREDGEGKAPRAGPARRRKRKKRG
jgi:hypothetical protein